MNSCFHVTNLAVFWVVVVLTSLMMQDPFKATGLDFCYLCLVLSSRVEQLGISWRHGQTQIKPSKGISTIGPLGQVQLYRQHIGFLWLILQETKAGWGNTAVILKHNTFSLISVYQHCCLSRLKGKKDDKQCKISRNKKPRFPCSYIPSRVFKNIFRKIFFF